MTKKLPVRLEDTYFEPCTLIMPGNAFVRRLTPREKGSPKFNGCKWAAENCNGEVLAAFGSIAGALIKLTAESCHINWQTHQ